ncbi:MAG: SulP family inorganic anion transporter [Pseudonocardiaceae bacterium]
MHSGPRSNLDRELVGQGAANSVSGLLGGLPVTGVIVRSSTNVAAGARTRTLRSAARWMDRAVLGVPDRIIEQIPLAVLAGLLVVIGLQLVKLADLRTARRQGELTIYGATVAGVVLLNLLEGVLIGLALSVLLMIRRVVRTAVRAEESGPGQWRVVVEGTLSFLSLPRLSRVLASVPGGHQGDDRAGRRLPRPRRVRPPG